MIDSVGVLGLLQEWSYVSENGRGNRTHCVSWQGNDAIGWVSDIMFGIAQISHIL